MRNEAERLTHLVQRAVTHSIAAADSAAAAGGILRMGPRWGSDHEARECLEKAATELRGALGLVGAAVELLDGETREQAA